MLKGGKRFAGQIEEMAESYQSQKRERRWEEESKKR